MRAWNTGAMAEAVDAEWIGLWVGKGMQCLKTATVSVDEE